MTKSKIRKRNIVFHEALAGKLSAEALHTILQPLLFDFWDKPLLLPFKTDSTCCLAMLNPMILVKNMLLGNAVASLKDELVKISIKFPKAMLTVGHIPGTDNPSDFLTKLYRNPIKIINSDLYRFGPPTFASKDDLCKDIVLTCQNGELRYLGLPKKFLMERSEDTERCNFCLEHYDNCALAQTRAQTKKEKHEDATEAAKEKEATVEIAKRKEKGNTPRERMTVWLEKTMKSFHLYEN